MLSSGGYAFNICVLMKMIIPLNFLTFWADFLKITSRLASSYSSQNDYEKRKQVLLVGKLLSSNSVVYNYKKIINDL